MKKVIKFIRFFIGIIIIIPMMALLSFLSIFLGFIFRLCHLYTLGECVPHTILRLLDWWIIFFLGSYITVEGKENLPKKGEKYCFFPNHNSVMDIPAIYATGRWPGMIAKKELRKVPIINGLLWLLHCPLIDRKSPKSAIEAIHKGTANIEKGIPMVIFPEGTRNKEGKVAEFKAGSFKMATRAKAKVVPVVIKNTRQTFEDAHYIGFVPLYVKILPPIDTSDMTAEEIAGLHTVVEERVRAEFEKIPSFPRKK